MFSIQAFVDDCRGALQSDDPSGTVASVLRDALQDRSEVGAAVHAWRESGGGAYGACLPSPVRRAFSTVVSAGMAPISRIWLQRKLNQPLRMTRHFPPVASPTFPPATSRWC